jgi:hypothetical protein
MYGIINKSIEALVIENFGIATWENVLEKSEIDTDFFISNEAYDDAITYKLANAIAIEKNISLSEVLIAFGEWWILRTTKEKYGNMIEAGGVNLRDFLVNLPLFHNRVMLIYPKLTPPEFKVSNIENQSIHIHYFSKREGLQDFVYGLLIGLGKLYATPTTVKLIKSRLNGESHEIFEVSW